MNVGFRDLIPNLDLPKICAHMPISPTLDTRGIVAYNSDDSDYLAMFIAQDWTPTSVQVHQVILKPMVLRHRWFEEIASYIFTNAGRLKMYGLVPSNNKRAISVNLKVGFTEVARLEEACDVGVDYVLMELRREDCPYWKPVNQLAA